MMKISSVSENAQEGSSEFARGGKGRIYIGEKKRREEEIGRRWKVGKPWEGEMIGGEEVCGLSPTSPPASWLQFLFRLPSLRGLSLRRSRSRRRRWRWIDYLSDFLFSMYFCRRFTLQSASADLELAG